MLLLLAFVLCVGSFICTLNAFHFVAISLAIIANNEYHNEYTLLIIENAIFSNMYILHLYIYGWVYVMLCWCLLFVCLFASYFFNVHILNQMHACVYVQHIYLLYVWCFWTITKEIKGRNSANVVVKFGLLLWLSSDID